jgi:ATP-dependent RNA helicase DHX36
MLGGYLEFFMEPTVADMYQSIRRELDDFIQSKVGAHAQTSFSLLFEIRLVITKTCA